VELRPELPGDQRQHVGNFLAHFPGFADQSILDTKIDEALDRIIRAQSNGTVDYAKQVKPLIAGPLVIAAQAADLTAASSGGPPAGFLVVATTDGKASCGLLTSKTTAGDTYRGFKYDMLGGSESTTACGLDGRFMLLGSVEAIKAAVDARQDGKGIDGSATFRTARERLTGDQVAYAFLDGKRAMSSLETFAPSLGIDAALGAGVPDWVIAGIRVVDDAIQVEVLTPPLTSPALASGVPSDPPPAKSQFAAMLPADAFGFVEAHGMGATIQRAIAQLKADPAQKSAVDSFEEAVASLGGVQNLAAWIEDLGIAAVPVDDGLGAVVLIRGTDAAAAGSRFDQIRNLLVLASTGSDMKLTPTDHNGVSITTVDLGELGPTLEALGVPIGGLGATTRLSFALARNADVVIVGVGDGVVERVLDTADANAIATSDNYRRAIELAGSPNDVEAFVAIDAIAGWLEAHPLPGFDVDTYRKDTKPYLEHLAVVSASSITTDTGTRARLVLTVK
jgi:hypothetical protein